MPKSKVRPAASWLHRFGVVPDDPGDVYVLEHGGRYKVGRSKTSSLRLRAAKTWLPDAKIIGVKPFWNVTRIERHIHEGFARCWYAGEWFELIDEGYREVFLEGFMEFSDTDRDNNSVDFIYWFNSNGMAEFVIERYRQGLTLPSFLRQESEIKK